VRLFTDQINSGHEYTYLYLKRQKKTKNTPSRCDKKIENFRIVRIPMNMCTACFPIGLNRTVNRAGVFCMIKLRIVLMIEGAS
jgi:hypothetical protein